MNVLTRGNVLKMQSGVATLPPSNRQAWHTVYFVWCGPPREFQAPGPSSFAMKRTWTPVNIAIK